MNATDPETRIREHSAGAVLLDLEALVRTGRRRKFSQRAALVGGVAVLAGLTAGVVVLIQPTGSGSGKSQVAPATSPRTDRGLLKTNAADGTIQSLLTTPTGWRAQTYVDAAGELCEGWLDPATAVLDGACGAELIADGPRNEPPPVGGGTAQIDSPILIEPAAADPKHAVYAFGIAGPNTASVTVTDRGRQLPVRLSDVKASDGERAFLVRYRYPKVADWVDTATSLDANGNSLGSMMFVAPDTGRPAGPQSTPTP